MAERCNFEMASVKDYPGRGYDLVTCFDCLHDMGDPVGAASHVRDSLAADGTWMLVEPFAGDRVEDNLNLTPVGRVFYAASTMPGCGRWPRRPASGASAVPRRRRSAWSSRPDPEGRDDRPDPLRRRSVPGGV